MPFVTVERSPTWRRASLPRTTSRSASPPACSASDEGEKQQFLDGIEAGVVYINRAAGATTGAWPGYQTFGGWKGSGSTGKSAFGPHYVQLFMREQSRTILP